MLFPTLTFAIFFAFVFPLSWLLRRHARAWKWFALGASYVFYGAWDWRFVSLIILSTFANGLLARGIGRPDARAARRYLALAVTFNLVLLGTFKYYGFFSESLNDLLVRAGLEAPVPYLDIVLPVGISFYTFQALSYVIDVYRHRVPVVPLLDFGVYLAFFPQLVAGPIVRASEFLPQLYHPRGLTRPEASRAAVMIGAGLFKKVVVSSYVAAAIVDPVFAAPMRFSSLELIAGIYAYAVQIYADFSGYTDIAIGVALLLGYRFPDNFNNPYAADSIRDFWRRWHMTLSRWLRDYLYIPLGGNRKGRRRTYANLLITMVLGGLWHGANFTFVFWGLYHGVLLAFERWRMDLGAAGAQLTSAPWLNRLVAFHLVCVGWVLFRAATMEDAAIILVRAVTAWGPAPAVTPVLVAVIAGALVVQQLPDRVGERFRGGLERMPGPVQGVAVGAWLFLCVALGPEGVAPFIYFQF